ncbi:hypothetical protein PMAYCL1PPCAC_03858, partial [Pristionchus mayeri]
KSETSVFFSLGSNADFFPLNVLFYPTVAIDESLSDKLLQICEIIVAESQLQKAWKEHRDIFKYIIGSSATSKLDCEIQAMFQMENDDD